MTVFGNHINTKNLTLMKVLAVRWLRFINYSHFLPPQGGSTSKILSPGSGDTSVRQKDLWFDRISDRAGGEAERIMADSVFNDGMNVCQLHNSLSSRGRGELQSDCIRELYFTDNIEVSFQPLNHPEPAVLGCAATLMPPAVWGRAAALPWQMSMSRSLQLC